MALSNQTREAIIPPPAPPSINEKEELRQVGFLLKQKGVYLIFRASTSIMVDGWSNHVNPAEYADAFGSCVRGTTFSLHKIAFNKWKPAKTDVYVVQLPSMPPKLVALFEEMDQQFIYNGTCPTTAMNVAKQLITEIAESIK